MEKPTLTTLRAKIARLRAAGKKWREIGLDYPGVPLGTLCRIANDPAYTPKKTTMLRKLGLPKTAPAPVCQVHGVVHIGSCPKPKRAPKSLFDWPIKALTQALRERV